LQKFLKKKELIKKNFNFSKIANLKNEEMRENRKEYAKARLCKKKLNQYKRIF